MYCTATIGRYDRYLTFDSVEDLREELSTYLTQTEKNCKILDRLTDFDPKRRDADGMVVNNWRDIRTDCYVGEV